MKIINIEFHGFKAKNRHAKVNFSNDNVTVIFGDNGCGKTTFLKAINSFLSQDNDELSSIGIYKVICHVSSEREINIVCVELKDDGYDWSEFENSCLVNSKSLSLGVERGVSTQSMKIEPEVLMNFFSHPRRQHELLGDPRGAGLSKKSIYELSEELSYFLRRRNAARFRNKRPEIDFEKRHLYFK